MSLHRIDNNLPPSQAQSFSLLSCFHFRKSYPHIKCRQCSPCDYFKDEWESRIGERKKKLENKPTARLLCNRLREGFLDWPRFTESDVNEINAATSCARIPASRTSTYVSTSGSSSESDTTAQKGKVSSCSTRTYRRRKTTIHRKEEKIDLQNKKIDDLSNKIAVLEESEKNYQPNGVSSIGI